MSDTDNLLIMAANGNQDALAFMRRFLALAHKVDDVVDGPEYGRAFTAQVFTEVVSFYSTDPFYLSNRPLLYPLVMASMDFYTNSVLWEKSDEESKKRLSDVLRSTGTMVVNFVALLCGGMSLMREVSPQFVLDSWVTHHKPDGKPI